MHDGKCEISGRLSVQVVDTYVLAMDTLTKDTPVPALISVLAIPRTLRKFYAARS